MSKIFNRPITEADLKVIQQENQDKTENLLDNIFNALGIMNDDSFGVTEVASLLELPDNQFELLSEYLLGELEKSLMSTNTKMILQDSMDQANVKPEEFILLQDQLMDEVQEKFEGQYSQNKIDFLKRIVISVFNVCKEAYGVKKMITIPVEVNEEHDFLPSYAHDTDAAMDIYAIGNYTVNPGETVLVKTGMKVAIPNGYALLIQPRSGQSLKTKLRVANSPGLIDSGYREEIGVIIENVEAPIKNIEYDFDDTGAINIKSIEHGKPFIIEDGQRIAQMRLVEAPKVSWERVNNILEYSSDRNGGFGSSGNF